MLKLDKDYSYYKYEVLGNYLYNENLKHKIELDTLDISKSINVIGNSKFICKSRVYTDEDDNGNEILGYDNNDMANEIINSLEITRLLGSSFCKHYGYFTMDDVVYSIMENIEGIPLSIINNEGYISERDFGILILQILIELMTSYNSFGFIHGDLHQGNIVVITLDTPIFVKFEESIFLSNYRPVFIDFDGSTFEYYNWHSDIVKLNRANISYKELHKALSTVKSHKDYESFIRYVVDVINEI